MRDTTRSFIPVLVTIDVPTRRPHKDWPMNQIVVTKRRVILLLAIIFPVVAIATGLGFLLFQLRVKFVRVPDGLRQVVKWHEFAPESGIFTVSFPGTPHTRSEYLPDGPELVHTAIVETPNRIFKVTWQHVSPTEPQVAPMLENTLRILLERIRAEKVVTTNTTSTAAALECVGKGIVNGRSVSFRCRLVFANENVYTLLWLGAEQSTLPSDVDRFFQSFDCATEWKNGPDK